MATVADVEPTDAARLYERTLIQLEAAGHKLPQDPAHKAVTVEMFAERYKVEDLEVCPEYLWETIEEARWELPSLHWRIRYELHRPARASVPCLRLPSRARRGRAPRQQRSRVTRRARAPSGEPDEPEPPSRRLPDALLAAHLRGRAS